MTKEFEMAKGLPEGELVEWFSEETIPNPVYLPLPEQKESAVQAPVQSSAEQHDLKLDQHLCDVCKDNEVHGVYASSCGPISFGYCLKCGEKGAEPYAALLAYISSAYSVSEWDTIEAQDRFRKARMVGATLEVAGKDFTEFVKDVRESITKLDEEMNEFYRKEQFREEVTNINVSISNNVYSLDELTKDIYSLVTDTDLTNIVYAEYERSMTLFKDEVLGYVLFKNLGNKYYSYHNRVEFISPNDLRLTNKED